VDLINQRSNNLPAIDRINIIHDARPIAGLVRFEYPAPWNIGPFQLVERLNDPKRISRILPEQQSTSFYFLELPL
jgi:hypothetical protein